MPILLNYPRHNTSHQSTQDLFDHVLTVSAQNLEYNKDFIVECLNSGADITITDNYMHNNTAISWVIANAGIKHINTFLNILNDYYKEHPQIFRAALDAQDDDGKSALILAVMKGWIHKNEDDTTLESPMMHTAIKALVENGVNLNLSDKWGNTALHIAILRRDADAVEYFLRNGADVSLENTYGLKPPQMLIYDYAEACQEMEKKCVACTMQDENSFDTSYERIKKIFFQYLPVATKETTLNNYIFKEDPVIVKTKINKLLPRLHTLFKNNVHKITTEEEVFSLLEQEQIAIQLFKRDASLDTLISQVNQENATAKTFGYSNKYWDCIYQFVKALFGKDRSSIIDTAFNDYKKSLVERRFVFMPLYKELNNPGPTNVETKRLPSPKNNARY